MKQILASLMLLTLFVSCNLIDKFKNEPEPLLLPIVGTWEIVTYKGADNNGRFHYPFNEVKGQAMFDTANNYSIQFFDAEREKLSRPDPYFSSDPEIRIAFLTYRSSYGTYKFEDDVLILEPKAANIPNLAAFPEKRPFIIKGDSMLMYSPPIKLNGIEMIEHTLWVRKR